jgi:hypothetical protein
MASRETSSVVAALQSKELRPTRRDTVLSLSSVPIVLTQWIRPSSEALPSVLLIRDPRCSRSSAWADHLREAGFQVEVTEVAAVSRLKERLGVPPELASCHTARVAGFLIEGHVPAAAVKRLIAEKPVATGLAVPGLPAGAPGLEGGPASRVYDVVLFGPGGHRVFARFRGAQEV